MSDEPNRRLRRINRRHALYRITGPGGKAYIGMTTTAVEARLDGHVIAAFGIYGHTFGPNTLAAAIRKHGAVAFSIEQVGSAENEAAAHQMERQLIIAHGTLAPHGWNLQMARSTAPRDWIAPKGNRPWPPMLEAA